MHAAHAGVNVVQRFVQHPAFEDLGGPFEDLAGWPTSSMWECVELFKESGPVALGPHRRIVMVARK